MSDYAARLDCPVLVIHSRHDEIIPFEMGQAIYEALGQQGQLLAISGDHNNGFLLSYDEYVAGLNSFIQALLEP